MRPSLVSSEYEPPPSPGLGHQSVPEQSVLDWIPVCERDLWTVESPMWVACWRSFCGLWCCSNCSSWHKTAPPTSTRVLTCPPAMSPKLKDTVNPLAVAVDGLDTLEEHIQVQYLSSLLGLTACSHQRSHWDLSWDVPLSEFWWREILSMMEAANSNLTVCGNWKCPHKSLLCNNVSLKRNRRRTDWFSTLCVLQCQSGWHHIRITVIITVKILAMVCYFRPSYTTVVTERRCGSSRKIGEVSRFW